MIPLHAAILACAWTGIGALGAVSFVAAESVVGGVIAVAALHLAGQIIVFAKP